MKLLDDESLDKINVSLEAIQLDVDSISSMDWNVHFEIVSNLKNIRSILDSLSFTVNKDDDSETLNCACKCARKIC